MDARRDAGLAAAEAALAIERDPGQPRAGSRPRARCASSPGIPTAVAGRATLAVDLRNPDAEALARMLEAARAACR